MMEGRCHCGNIVIQMETRADPAELPLRACACTFCRKHGARTTSDPAGRVRIQVSHAGLLSRYRWGLATADFFVCARCGVYAAAVLTEGAAAWAIVNAGVFDDQAPWQREPQPVSYEGESAAERIARRKLRWTPAEVAVSQAGTPTASSPPPDGGGRTGRR
jgi:hypothetical protein